MQLFDSTSLSTILWPDTEEALQIKEYFTPLLERGVSAFIPNVKTRLFLAQVGATFLPLAVNEKEYDNAYVASNYVCMPLIEKTLQEHMAKWMAKPLVHTISGILKGAKINQVVSINNWFITSNLYPDLAVREVEALISGLTQRFPTHAFMWRLIREGKLMHSLQRCGFKMIPARTTYLFNPVSPLDHRAERHHRIDQKLFKEKGYEVVPKERLSNADMEALCALYIKLYIGKYFAFSPRLTKEFIENFCRVRGSVVYGLRKNGCFEGVVGLLKRGCEMIMPFIGHNTELAPSEGVFRMLNQLAFEEAKRGDLLFNQSSGAEQFKAQRGGKPATEYIAVYDKHLPILRKSFWSASSLAASFLKS